MSDNIKIRTARPEDAPELLKIYAPYVENTAITFEYEVPSIEDFKCRIERTLKKYPYLVAERDGELLGYAYTGEFKERAAYDWAVETSIYVRQDRKGLGLGRRLYAALEAVSRLQNVLNLYACIAYPKAEDEYLTRNSVEFHAHLGFKLVGEFHNCAYKFNRWYNMVWMELSLSDIPENPGVFIPYPALSRDELMKIGIE